MKKTALLTALVSIALLSHGRAGLVDFNTYTSPSDNDLVNQFQLNQNGSGSAPFSQLTTGGVTGGYVSVDANSYGRNGIYSGQAFSNAVGQEMSLSAYVKFSSSAFQSSGWVMPLRLSWLPSPASISESAPSMFNWLENEIGGDHTKFHLRVGFVNAGGSGNAVFSSGNFDLQDGHWYKLSTTLTKLDTQNYDVGGALSDYGATGLEAPTLLANVSYLSGSAITAYYSQDFANLSTIYAGFNAQGPGGASGVDNFSADISGVPEPATGLAGIAVGAIALFSRQRRRQSQNATA